MNFALPFDLAHNLPRDSALMDFEDRAHRRAFYHQIISLSDSTHGPWQSPRSKRSELKPSNRVMLDLLREEVDGTTGE
jgi:hypothetical protein